MLAPMQPSRKHSVDSMQSLLELLHLAGGCTVLVFGVFFWVLGMRGAALVEVVYGTLTLSTLVVLRFRSGSFDSVVWLQVLVVSFVPLGVSVFLGGLLGAAGFMVWGIIGPLAAMMFLGRSATWISGGIFLGCLVLSALLPAEAPWVTPPPRWFVPALGVANIAGASILALGTLSWFVRRLRSEQERADLLSLSILPPEVGRLLRGSSTGKPRFPHGASILQADIVDLQPLMEQLEDVELADLLTAVYAHFDELASGLPLMRVPTMVDTYMVIAGMPEPSPQHARHAAELALAMRRAVSSRRFAGQRIELRVSISSGPVRSGARGRRRFIYELWGRAASLASRMANGDEQGCIMVTEDAHALLARDYRLRPTKLRTSSSTGGVAVYELLDALEEPYQSQPTT
jgi:class 3 adenylate cyclase